jgi:hypothetical protein
LRLPPQGVLWLAPERAPVDEIGAEAAADIGQSTPVGDTPSAAGVGAPVSPTAGAADHTDMLAVDPDVVRAVDSDVTYADVNGADPARADMPELTSGDGAITGGIDQAYALDETAFADSAPDPALGDAALDEPALDEPALDAAPSAGVSADAPVVAPEVPQVVVSPLGAEPEAVPADVAQEDEPPVLEATPGAPDAVLDEPRFASDVAERPITVGGSPEALEASTPSATRSPLDEPLDDPRDDTGPGSTAPSSTHQ